MWSHKLGEKRPTRLDNAGQTIMDPRAALRLPNCPYNFVSFMTSNRNVVIRGDSAECRRALQKHNMAPKCTIL